MQNSQLQSSAAASNSNSHSNSTATSASLSEEMELTARNKTATGVTKGDKTQAVTGRASTSADLFPQFWMQALGADMEFDDQEQVKVKRRVSPTSKTRMLFESQAEVTNDSANSAARRTTVRVALSAALTNNGTNGTNGTNPSPKTNQMKPEARKNGTRTTRGAGGGGSHLTVVTTDKTTTKAKGLLSPTATTPPANANANVNANANANSRGTAARLTKDFSPEERAVIPGLTPTNAGSSSNVNANANANANVNAKGHGNSPTLLTAERAMSSMKVKRRIPRGAYSMRCVWSDEDSDD